MFIVANSINAPIDLSAIILPETGTALSDILHAPGNENLIDLARGYFTESGKAASKCTLFR